MNTEPQTIKNLAANFLARYNVPMHVDEIAKYISRYRACNSQSVIKCCNREKEFIYIKPKYAGLQSKKYNIEEWKKQNIEVFGTISDFVEQFLAKHDLPCNIDEIVKYVSEYRSFNANYLIANCWADKRFIVVRSKYIMLRTKKYNLGEWRKQTIGIPGSACDMAADYLTRQNMPCHKNEIIKYIKKYRNYDGHKFSTRLASDNRFIRVAPAYFGLRTKKYNLNEWRKQNIAAISTFPDLIEGFLALQSTPRHIDEIVKYVSKFRICKASSLLQHCWKDDRFIVARSGHIRLREKKYNLAGWNNQNAARLNNVCDIVESFLTGRDTPCHKEIIAKYIIKYRNTRGMMHKIGQDKRFVLPAPGYVCLRTKKYNLAEWKKQNMSAYGAAYLMENFLKKRNSPCHKNEIAKYVSKYLPIEAHRLRELCSRNKQRFISIEPGYIGLRAKNYNLKEWRQQHITVFGSIAEIVATFVARYDAPCQLKAITTYIRRFRETDATGVMDHVRRDKWFIIYEGKYIGLWSKEYDEKELEKYKIIKGATVGDIVKQFLVKQNAPCHLDEITEYVSSYHRFDPIWIMGNLKDDKRFRVLKNERVNLRKGK